jgi:amino acid transporter
MNFIIPVGVAISTFGCALSGQFATARLCYVAGREGHMVEAFSYIHVRRLTPAPAVLLQVSGMVPSLGTDCLWLSHWLLCQQGLADFCCPSFGTST